MILYLVEQVDDKAVYEGVNQLTNIYNDDDTHMIAPHQPWKVGDLVSEDDFDLTPVHHEGETYYMAFKISKNVKPDSKTNNG